jgi:glyoxylate reductase
LNPPRILVTRIFPPIAVQLLREAGLEVTEWTKDTLLKPEKLIRLAKQHSAILCTLTDKIDKDFLAQCSHLQLISQFGVGYDNIDIGETTRLRIPVGNTPGVLTDATADLAFTLMLTVARKVLHVHKSILKGEWKYFQPNKDLGLELKGRTLGIFGMGRIGIEMALRCKGAYLMKVIYHNRKQDPVAEKETGAQWVSFADLLSNSDILSVHSVLSDETRGIFNKSAFSEMKPSAIFINTARGGIHNEADLLEALKLKKIWGTGLDVTNPEPMLPDNPLLNMENVAVLPHVGSGTVEARTEMARLAAMNIVEFYRSGKMPHCVNPEVLTQRG